MASITYYELSNYNGAKLIPREFILDGLTAEEHAAEVAEWLEELTAETGELCEEWIVCDYENVPAFFVGEWSIDDSFFEFQSTEGDAEAKAAYIDCFGEWDAARFEESYSGEWATELEYAENLIAECYDIESLMGSLSFYFDYEKFTRDLFSCDYTFAEGFVFRNC